MYEVKAGQDLKPFNTFAISVKADFLAVVDNLADLKTLLSEEKYKSLPKMFLGGGSNLLLTQDYHGLVVVVQVPGKEVVSETESQVIVRAGAGENWHELVLWAIDQDLGGLENLSFIPGCVGAAPMQNIGAYGAEVRSTVERVECLNLETLETTYFNNEQCNFGYRDSYFKREGKNKFVITAVEFRLDKAPHTLNTSYGAIPAELEKLGVTAESATIKDVSAAVTAIRKSKLPDPKEIGTAGSFFKNPIISGEQFQKLLAANPGVPSFSEPNGMVKVPAGWLIEQAGWKGFRDGDAGVHKDHALVLVNYANASGAQVWELAQKIQANVKAKYEIELEPEVNVI
jgi:UDP-N-acetylmuramate dehydrogenase